MFTTMQLLMYTIHDGRSRSTDDSSGPICRHRACPVTTVRRMSARLLQLDIDLRQRTYLVMLSFGAQVRCWYCTYTT